MMASMAVEAVQLPDVQRELLIGGSWRSAANGQRFGVEDPATGEVVATVADAGPEDGEAALLAAHHAQPSWGRTSPRFRSDILLRVYEAVVERRDWLATIITIEMGKPIEEARSEVDYSAGFFRWFAEEAVRAEGRMSRLPEGGGHIITTKQPVGPTIMVTPWNFPLAMGARKIAPAVAAGCTMIVKPAHQTPLTMLALASLFLEAGLPPGVLSVIPTTRPAEVVEPLLRNTMTRKLTFTGSTGVGRRLTAVAAERLLRVSMELGGDAPFIVFEDAEISAAVQGALQAKMRNMGQACTAANRFYVHESVARDFIQAIADAMSAMPVGHGLNPRTQIGPLIDEKACSRVAEVVDLAVKDSGNSLVLGGHRLEGSGYFFEPTVISTNGSADAITGQEIFGPVAIIHPFRDDDSLYRTVNLTPYGLSSYVYTRSLARAFRAVDELECGMVGINRGIVSNPAAPFGGVKESGLGREGGHEGLEEYLETRYVALTT